MQVENGTNGTSSNRYNAVLRRVLGLLRSNFDKQQARYVAQIIFELPTMSEAVFELLKEACHDEKKYV